MLDCRTHQFPNSGFADATCRIVDYAAQGFVVVWVCGEAEIGDGVFDLFALVERQTSVDAVGYVAFAQRFLKASALGIGSVENGEFVERVVAAHGFFR